MVVADLAGQAPPHRARGRPKLSDCQVRSQFRFMLRDINMTPLSLVEPVAQAF